MHFLWNKVITPNSYLSIVQRHCSGQCQLREREQICRVRIKSRGESARLSIWELPEGSETRAELESIGSCRQLIVHASEGITEDY